MAANMEKILISEDRYGRKLNNFESDDIIDRLNNRYTVLALIMCIFIVMGKTHVGEPINCWAPAQFSGTHITYTNSICWLKGSYYLPTEEITIPDRSKPRTYHISYYQWTAFILLGMAMLFLVPRYIWEAFVRQSGVNVKRLVKTIKDNPNNGEQAVGNSLSFYLYSQRASRGMMFCGMRCPCSPVFTATYFAIKILYIINTIAQFFLLNTFLAFHFTSYGAEALNKLFSGEDWFESPRFPRVTMCDFMIRHLGSNQHWYAIQCNLPINIFNEKIFLGVWVWLIILTILNILSIIPWILFLSRNQRSTTIRRYLAMFESLPKEQKPQSSSTQSSEEAMPSRSAQDKFDERDRKTDLFIDFLGIDGFLVFYIIARNTDVIATVKIIGRLYNEYKPDLSIRFRQVHSEI